MAQFIPLQALPNQQLNIQLANQPCTIHVRQNSTGMYLDLYVNNVLIIGGVICLNRVRIVRNAYLGFIGDLAFVDTQPGTHPMDPIYTGLGARFQLAYLEAADLQPVV